jgi:DNA processing protein
VSWLAGADDSSEGPMAPREVISLADARYPAALLEAADPPLLLFTQGRLDLLSAPAVALVGSRHATPQGVDNARAFAQALSEAGLTVISGLADGIDGAAHEGALDGLASAGSLSLGSTIAVVGTGLDRVYPRKHHGLAHRIAQHGLMLSEFTLGTPPLPANFPKRNRIVAALARGTLVVEAAVQSGSLITARLIKQGAKLVETAQDVMDELNWGHSSAVAATGAQILSLNDDEGAEGDPVLDAMGFDPVSQDALSARTGMGPAELGARLLELELDGRVARLPGQLFQRVARA